MKKYETLKMEYPEYISLDQLHRICGIAKRSARYLVEHGIIPAVDTGKKTWRYKIALDDVITYLRRREQVGSMIPYGKVSSRKDRAGKSNRRCYADMVKPGKEHILNEYFIFIFAEAPDVLSTDDVSAMTGLEKSTVEKLIRAGNLTALKISGKYLVPKEHLIEFVVTPRYIDSKCNSVSFKKILGGFEIWKASKNEMTAGGGRL